MLFHIGYNIIFVCIGITIPTQVSARIISTYIISHKAITFTSHIFNFRII